MPELPCQLLLWVCLWVVTNSFFQSSSCRTMCHIISQITGAKHGVRYDIECTTSRTSLISFLCVCGLQLLLSIFPFILRTHVSYSWYSLSGFWACSHVGHKQCRIVTSSQFSVFVVSNFHSSHSSCWPCCHSCSGHCTWPDMVTGRGYTVTLKCNSLKQNANLPLQFIG